jgi:hypothetical protein
MTCRCRCFWVHLNWSGRVNDIDPIDSMYAMYSIYELLVGDKVGIRKISIYINSYAARLKPIGKTAFLMYKYPRLTKCRKLVRPLVLFWAIRHSRVVKNEGSHQDSHKILRPFSAAGCCSWTVRVLYYYASRAICNHREVD